MPDTARQPDVALPARLPAGPLPAEVVADLGDPALPETTTPKAMARVLDCTDRIVGYAIRSAGVESEERRGCAPVLDRRAQLDTLAALEQIQRRPSGDSRLADRAAQLRASLQAHFAVETARRAARVAVEFHAARVLGLHKLSLREAVESELREFRAILPATILADMAAEVAP